MKTKLRHGWSLFAAALAGFTQLSTLTPQPTSAQSPLPDSFNPGANARVLSLAVQASGKIVVGGGFTTLGGQTRKYIGRLNADGTLDSGFNPGADNWVLALAAQADGKILVGGSFNTLASQPRVGSGRLNADGTLDSGFNPGVVWGTNVGLAHTVQADGKILLIGEFKRLAGQLCNYIGRLNADGTLDSAFNPGASEAPWCLTLQADANILVGGRFTTLGAQARNRIARLNANGTVDSVFNPGADNWVLSLAVQRDNKILVGGYFTTLGGQPRNYIGRLNADGTLDTGFSPGANGGVWSLVVQADGKIVVGGEFTTLAGQARSHIGRLNADGTLDSNFDPGANDWVGALALQADGKILVGGLFTTLGGQTRNYIGRLNNTGPATESLTFDGSTITWLRGGTSPEVWRTTFDFSTDGLTWTSLGAGTRRAGGWELAVACAPLGGVIRARGWATGGRNNDSSWFVESQLQFASPVMSGIDISYSAGEPTQADFRSICAQGYRFVIVNGWGGISSNPHAQKQLANARAAGLLTAGYCYLNFNSAYDGARQVRNALANFGPEAAYLGFLAIDVERYDLRQLPPGLLQNPPDPSAQASAVSLIAQAVAQVTSVWLKPVIYSNKDSWNWITGADTTHFNELPLWEPTTLGGSDITQPDLSSDSYTFGGWTSRVGKQYVISGSPSKYYLQIPHIEVDLDVLEYGAFSLSNPNYQPLDLTAVIHISGNQPLISWNNPAATLEEAPSVNGPWSAVPNATAPFAVNIHDVQHYYRIR
jgi:uncharacterized delta-60 repeat protein